MTSAYVQNIVQKYSKDLAKKGDSFDARIDSLTKFHDPGEENIERITEEYQDLIIGDGVKTHGIRGVTYKSLQDVFGYDPKTRKAKKEKLSEAEVEKFFDHHIEEFIKTIAVDDFNDLKAQYKDDDKAFKKHLRSLYNLLTQRDGQHKHTIEQQMDIFKRSDLSYRTFKQNYDSLLEEEIGALTNETQNYIVSELIDPMKDRRSLAKKVEAEAKDHKTLEYLAHPLVHDAYTNLQSYMRLLYPQMNVGDQAAKNLHKFNLKFKKTSKAGKKNP